MNDVIPFVEKTFRVLNDKDHRAIAGLSMGGGHTLAATMTATLKDGRKVTQRVEHFKGTPESPLDRAEMRDKFLLLTRDCDRNAMARLFDRIQSLEAERNLDWVKVPARGKARKAATNRNGSKRRKAA